VIASGVTGWLRSSRVRSFSAAALSRLRLDDQIEHLALVVDGSPEIHPSAADPAVLTS